MSMMCYPCNIFISVIVYRVSLQLFELILLKVFRRAAFTRSYYVILCVKQSKSHNSCKLCRYGTTASLTTYQDQQCYQIRTHPDIRFQRVVYTKSYYVTQCIKQPKSHNSYMLCGIKMMTGSTTCHNEQKKCVYDRKFRLSHDKNSCNRQGQKGFPGNGSTTTINNQPLLIISN